MKIKWKIFVAFVITIFAMSCDDEEGLKDQIVVRVDGSKSVILKVHRPTGIDSFGDCTIAFIRTATNRIEDYRQVAIRIDDLVCDLKNKVLPYEAEDFFLYYSNGVGGPDYHNYNNRSESQLTLTRFSDTEVRGNFQGKLYEENDQTSFVEIAGSFQIPIE